MHLLYDELTARGWSVWWDRRAMPSRGLKFTQEIRDAIDATDRLLLVIGPAAVRSDYGTFGVGARAAVRERRGACSPPGGVRVRSRRNSRLHCPDLRITRAWTDAREELFRILTEPIVPLGPFLTDVPALPPHFLPRPEELARLQTSVLADVDGAVVITAARQLVAINGMAGLGKSVLAAAFCALADTRRSFADGVAWLRMGRQPDLLGDIRRIGLAFGDEATNYLDLETAQARLPRVLESKVCLIVLDDVWEPRHVLPFKNALGARCRLLLTTRDSALVTAVGAEKQPLDLLTEREALVVLAEWSDTPVEKLTGEAVEIARECGHLPLALALCGAQIRDGAMWADIRDALKAAELDFIDHPYGSVMKFSKSALTHFRPRPQSDIPSS